MGYRSNYFLTTHDRGSATKFKVDQWICDSEKKGFSIGAYGVRLDEEIWEITWYNNEKDVKELSKAFPDTVFLLERVGEEPGDLCQIYFKNGKMQVAQARIIYDDYDESKLK